ncbi:fused MFS/spermidine synthase [Brevundimonas lutea]|uniref:fused MFS/spermidine synthase n=1 Tax=Brevundimonas lutea TaxID=2293980 RepID=UPI000F02E081|nr:fused MFS/spermidine synthase [Brevundimonas lutea]
MTDLAASPGLALRLPRTALFVAAIFTSAALVFTVQPMIAKMILPTLGGSPAVWNASMAFFQAALLAGYAYAHLLQRLPSLRAQFLVHLAALAGAAVVLPLGVTGLFGAPPVDAPVPWLLSVLAISIGLPFAALSATAPLLQAWYAKTHGAEPGAGSPYAFYAASNLGSMLALLSYPLVIEPFTTVDAQTLGWTLGYFLFSLVIALVAITGWRYRAGAAADADATAESSAARITWRERGIWLLLAAAPSSLMLGATTYISADVASAPFLWVAPLALYLFTFVIAFQTRPLISKDRGLRWHAVFAAMAIGLMCVHQTSLAANLVTHLGAFFFTALVCHCALADRRPPPSRLTEFYLVMSLGGVVGGAFTAFVAPVLFETVVEYPLVLALAVLARPWRGVSLSRAEILCLATAVLAAGAIALAPKTESLEALPLLLAVVSVGGALFLARRALWFFVALAALVAQSIIAPPDKLQNLHVARSFFGVHRVTLDTVPEVGGPVHLLFHGTTLHGAQPLDPAFRCQPTNYYAPVGAIGQTYTQVLAGGPGKNIAVVGLGGGSVAAFTRPGDRLRFFEIDPEVERIARDPASFTYIAECAQGAVDVVIGDARLTLAREPRASYDLLHLDAFSSDAVPTHLLTVEALGLYLDALKPEGVLLLHISNRNLALEAPAAATARALGAHVLMQEYAPPAGTPHVVSAPSQVMIVARTPAALAPFAGDPRWRQADDKGIRPWTDDYTNVVGAILDQALPG